MHGDIAALITMALSGKVHVDRASLTTVCKTSVIMRGELMAWLQQHRAVTLLCAMRMLSLKCGLPTKHGDSGSIIHMIWACAAGCRQAGGAARAVCCGRAAARGLQQAPHPGQAADQPEPASNLRQRCRDPVRQRPHEHSFGWGLMLRHINHAWTHHQSRRSSTLAYLRAFRRQLGQGQFVFDSCVLCS